ncbi:AGE family epimerase/isomerase [Ereboglobus luteus]|uniref:N-acylglucosamine 2-epimerase n=1 Tax=Ereboglobus luteus TaxID=1796921 RepID=A0A2U8E3R1_9BACT|nr:AGE family epimerase/isomerase [Ereboglobus luteus]AWI09529.1 N-acylglucosamine 2-epimerase [Ereboglobus luteus]
MKLTRERLAGLRQIYRDELLERTIPFWLRHGIDCEHGGMLTGLARDGTVIDTDKALWLQGRAVWMFSTLCNTIRRDDAWLEAARSCIGFIRAHGRGPGGKLYFQVTREGAPLRMRRYFFSECFAAMGAAAYAKASGEHCAAEETLGYFSRYIEGMIMPDGVAPKVDAETRPSQGLAAQMMLIVIAQEVRAALGDVAVAGETCSSWVDRAVETIARDFYKPEHGALLETVAPDGSVIDHFDGRTLNPGHAIECAWFILREAKERGGDTRLRQLGLAILDCMWARGWDAEHGGLFSFTDLRELPVQEYTAEMKFWWPHNEAEIATLLAWQLTREPKYAEWFERVRAWSRRVFADPEFGEWFGYAHRDGAIATRLKGNMWKGPFHVPRMMHRCGQIVDELLSETAKTQ